MKVKIQIENSISTFFENKIQFLGFHAEVLVQTTFILMYQVLLVFAIKEELFAALPKTSPPW